MVKCGKRVKTCRKCGHRYTKGEYDLWKCPVCGEDRHCLRNVAYEGKACWVHGGASPRGVASASYVHGRYSKYVPTRLLARYEAATTDPELLNLSAEIALLDSRISDVLSRVDAGESGVLWREMGRLRRAFLAAQRVQDQDGMQDALLGLLGAVGRGHADFEAWADVVDLLERRRRLVESEQKRRVAMHMLIKVEEAVGSMKVIADAVRDAVVEHVDDRSVRREVLDAVQSALDRYLAGGVQEEVVGGGGC